MFQGSRTLFNVFSNPNKRMSSFEQILKANGLHHLYPILNRLGVESFTSLLNYTLPDLEDLGIKDPTERRRLKRIIEEHSVFDRLDEEKIIVCVRKRPIEDDNDDAIEISDNQITVNEPKLKVDLQSYTEKHNFVFDIAFEKNKPNEYVYDKGLSSIVRHVKEGGCGSIIAYGQTGTGKTYTMMEENTGIIYKALSDISTVKPHGVITFCEIYMGNIYDLLNKREKIVLREVGGIVHLTNSSSVEFRSYDDICRIINKGLNLRRTGVTGANSKSSRSHAVLIVSFDRKKSSALSSMNSLIFVDLAGSERGTDRKTSSSEIKNEGAEINKSLLALKECIRGIEQDKKHLPFRQSKLTQILKNSFVGESKTCIIATISPAYDNIEHTLNTLRYASRIKDFKKCDIKNPIRSSPNNSFVNDFSPNNSSLNNTILNNSIINNSSLLTNSTLFFSPRFSISQEIDSLENSFAERKKEDLRSKTRSLLNEVLRKLDKYEYNELSSLYNKLEEILKNVER